MDFVFLSYDSDAASALAGDLTARLQASGPAFVASCDSGVLAGFGACQQVTEGPVTIIGRQRGILDRAANRTVGLDALAGIADARAVLTSIEGWLAPYAFARLNRATDEFLVAVDDCGLSHVFQWHGPGVVAVSSSATLLAQLVRAKADPDGIGRMAVLGFMAFDDSPFAGVKKVLAGTALLCRRGRVERLDRSRPIPVGEPGRPAVFREHARQGAAVLRSIVSGMLAAEPDCHIELSGGMDSRMILAAMTPEQRRGRTAVTIGAPNTPDVLIAQDLARLAGMDHRMVDISPLASLPHDQLLKLVTEGARLYDFIANPFDRAVALFIEQRGEGLPRLSGQNGEFARGFYYPLQPITAPYEERQVDGLYSWRLATNDRVNPALFDPGWYAALETNTKAMVKANWERTPGCFGDDLDRLYLRLRMQNWCGSAYTVGQAHRFILSPFFDRRFLEWAAAAPPAMKKGSRLFAAVLAELDPMLAAKPLDSGIVPVDLVAGGVRNAARTIQVYASKISRKLSQRFLGATAKTVGSDYFVRTLGRQGLFSTRDIDEMVQLGIFSADNLPRALQAMSDLDKPTLSFLINVRAIIASTSADRLEPRAFLTSQPATGSAPGAI